MARLKFTLKVSETEDMICTIPAENQIMASQYKGSPYNRKVQAQTLSVGDFICPCGHSDNGREITAIEEIS